MAESERIAMEAEIVADPSTAPVIRGNWRDTETPLGGVGTRGGVRTIYFLHAGPDVIYLLTAYAKAARDDLSYADKKVLSKIVAAIKNEEEIR